MSSAQRAHLWKPGTSGNPGGRPKLPDYLRAIVSLSHDEVTKYVSKYARMKPAEIDELVLARQIPMIEQAICRIFQEAEAKGDFTRLAFLLDRAVGKIQVVIPDENDASLREIMEMSDQELIRLVKDKLPSLEKPGVA